MSNAINFFIGLAMAAGAVALNPLGSGISAVTSFVTGFANELLGASSEFTGDSIQSFIKRIGEAIKKRKELKRLQQFIVDSDIDNVDRFNQILKELNDSYNKNKKSKAAKSKSRPKKSEGKQKNLNAQMIIKLSTEILFNVDLEKYMDERSATFHQLTTNEKSDFINLIKLTIKVYIQDMFADTDNDKKIMAGVIVNAIEDRIDVAMDEIKKIIPFIANQNGGRINLSEVALAPYSPKYIIHECPNCGYDGDRLYVNEKENKTYCAACGKAYSILEYCEPDLWEQVNVQLGNIQNNFEAFKDNIGKQLNKTGQDISAIMEKLNYLTEDQYKTNADLQRQIREGFEGAVTKEYLEACMNGQAENLSLQIDNCFAKYCEQVAEQVALSIESTVNEINVHSDDNTQIILDAFKAINEENSKHNAYISQQLTSFGKQLGSLCQYAEDKFSGIDFKFDEVIGLLKNLCKNEYYQNMSNALGADFDKAIQNGFGQVEALTASSMAQIMSRIDSLAESAKNSDKKADKLADLIQKENQQLNGQLLVLQRLINDSTAEHRESFSLIIQGQNEIKNVLLATLGLNMSKDEVSKLYNHVMPTEYRINGGYDLINQPCLFCGAIGEISLTIDNEKAKCNVCGHEYRTINPFKIDEAVKDSIVSDNDKSLPKIEEINEWRNAHTAQWNNSGLLDKPNDFASQIVLMDGITDNICGAASPLEKTARVVILSSSVTEIHKDLFKHFIALQKIIVLPDVSGEYKFAQPKIYVPENVQVMGKTYLGSQIIAQQFNEE